MLHLPGADEGFPNFLLITSSADICFDINEDTCRGAAFICRRRAGVQVAHVSTCLALHAIVAQESKVSGMLTASVSYRKHH